MATEKMKIIYLSIILILISCNVKESIGFKFKKNNGKLGSHSEKIYKGNLEIGLSSIISSNQKYQGFDTHLYLKSKNKEAIRIDSMSSKIVTYKGGYQIISEIYEGYPKKKELNFPTQLSQNESKSFSVVIINQDNYEFDFGDSVKVQIEIFYNLEKEMKQVSFGKFKYYDKSTYIVMP